MEHGVRREQLGAVRARDRHALSAWVESDTTLPPTQIEVTDELRVVAIAIERTMADLEYQIESLEERLAEVTTDSRQTGERRRATLRTREQRSDEVRARLRRGYQALREALPERPLGAERAHDALLELEARRAPVGALADP